MLKDFFVSAVSTHRAGCAGGRWARSCSCWAGGRVRCTCRRRGSSVPSACRSRPGRPGSRTKAPPSDPSSARTWSTTACPATSRDESACPSRPSPLPSRPRWRSTTLPLAAEDSPGSVASAAGSPAAGTPCNALTHDKQTSYQSPFPTLHNKPILNLSTYTWKFVIIFPDISIDGVFSCFLSAQIEYDDWTSNFCCAKKFVYIYIFKIIKFNTRSWITEPQSNGDP